MKAKATEISAGVSGPDHGLSDELAQEILRAVSGIRYGSVEIIVHDSRVVQIERKEKVRFHQEGVGK